MKANSILITGLLALGAAVTPVLAGPVTWTFGADSGPNGMVFGDGAVITGSFQFDPNGTNVTNTSNGVYSNFQVASTAGSILPAVSAGSWYIDTNYYDGAAPAGPGADCCADSTGFLAVLMNPASPTVDGTSVPGTDFTGMKYFAVNFKSPDLGPSTSVYNGDKVYIGTSAEGYCLDATCGQQDASLAHNVYSPGTAYVIASGAMDHPVNTGAPEPSTFVLLGGSLVAVGLGKRRRFFGSR